MIVLGVDPGSRRTGYCVIEVKDGTPKLLLSGTINLKGSYPERLRDVYRAFVEIMDRFSPDTMAMEGVFYGKNFKTALRLGEVRGVIVLAAGQMGVEVFEYSPAEVKTNLVGYGSAVKEQVRYMVSQILGIGQDVALDESDAAAVALCHAIRERAI